MPAFLLQAIREQPDDDLARLAWADWLEEQGQRDRAELVRVQLEQERLPRNDPRAGPLAVRAGALLAEHERAWLGPWADRLVRWQFRRGFLDSVVLEPESFLCHGADLFAQHPVREVQFVDGSGTPCGPEAVEELAAAPAFDLIRSLDASGSSPPAGPTWCRALARLGKATRLEELHFDSDWRAGGVFNDGAALAELCQADGLRHLRKLTLGAPMATDALGDEALEDVTHAVFAPRLHTLSLAGLQISDAGARALAGCRALSGLHSLDLAWCEGLSRDGVQAVLDSPHLRSLEELSLGGDIDVAAIARAPLLAGLQELTLGTHANRYFRSFPTSAWAELARSPHAAGLRRLHLLYGLLTEEGAAGLFQTPGTLRLNALMIMGLQGNGDVLAGLLSAAPALAPLTALELPGCNITVAGMRQLLGAPFVGHLRLFCVAGNTVQSRGVEALLRSPLAAGGLTELHLHHCRLRPGTLRRLMSWRGLANVTRIELGNNTFDREAMAALLASPHTQRLTTLHLGSAHIQAAALLELARSAALPRLRDLTVPSDADADALAELRQRFGPRLAHDPVG
jgi:uncharacterized protein (TIGR02996 family)